MKKALNVKLVVVSVTLVSVIISLICALLIAIAPEPMLKFFGSMFHGVDISKISSSITLSGVLTSILAVIVTSAVISWIFVLTYNYLSNKLK